ncbi:hypothetical protein C3L33_08516, partial [Rhododendron williamsianum]
HLRRFTQSSAAAALTREPEILSVEQEFPKPDPKYAETIRAVPRAASGKNIAAKERKAGRVPSIVFEQEDGQHGGNKRLVSVQTNQIKKLVPTSGARSFSPGSLTSRSGLISSPRMSSRRSACCPERNMANDSHCLRFHLGLSQSNLHLHLHAGTDRVLNVTFIRAPSHALLKVEVPLVFRGDDISPGLKKGAYLNIIKRTVKYLCPADVIPPYIDVDLSELDVGQKLLMGDLKVHPDLKLVSQKSNLSVRLWDREFLINKRNQSNRLISIFFFFLFGFSSLE